MDGFRSSQNLYAEYLKFRAKCFYATTSQYVETFEEALQRLNITEQELEQRRKEFTRLMITYILIAIAVFAYGVYVVSMHKNIAGFIMCFAITIYTLTHAFRYHFWIYQIKYRKLGCSLRDWFLDKH